MAVRIASDQIRDLEASAVASHERDLDALARSTRRPRASTPSR